MLRGRSATDSNEVPGGFKEDLFRVIRYTSYWILYGFIALVIVSSLAAAVQGIQR
jgi:hypothetical protein